MLIPYLRRSRKDEEVISIDDQRRDIQAWAERAGVKLADEVVEKGVSGAKPWRERELGEVVARCERGEASGVVVAYFSRLTREKMSATYDVLETLEPYRRVFVREGRDITHGEPANLIEAVNGFQANHEWRSLSRNLRNGKHSAWQRGLYVGEAPAGFEKSRKAPLVQTEHAEAVKAAIRLRARGGSWTEVARLLTAKGVPTSKKGCDCRRPSECQHLYRTLWSRASAKAALRNPVYYGEHRCTCGCGGSVSRPEWRLVPKSVWKDAQPEPGVQSKGRQDRGQALLAGLLRCAGCGGTLTSSWTSVGGKEYRYYACKGRGPACSASATIPQAAAEQFVVEAALSHLIASEPVVGSPKDPKKRTRLEVAVEAAQAALDEVEAAADELTPLAYGRALDVAQAGVETAQAALDAYQEQVGMAPVSGPEIRNRWSRMPVEVRRRVLREILERVEVRNGRMPVAQKVSMRMRDLEWPRVSAAAQEEVAA